MPLRPPSPDEVQVITEGEDSPLGIVKRVPRWGWIAIGLGLFFALRRKRK